MADTPPILILAGPTAAGKTELAIRLAQQEQAEIISADSRQIYQRTDIGTGKPTAQELQAVRHHLVSAVPPETVMTADRYAGMAEACLEQIAQRGKKVLLVGGTGLWIRAFMDGLSPLPPADPDLRAALKARVQVQGSASLHAELQKYDPETASKLAPADAVRIIRALEIWLQTGCKASELRRQPTLQVGRRAVWVGITRPRAELYRRAEARIQAWIQSGWREEVRELLDQGISPEAPAMKAIGYSHLVQFLQNGCTWEKMMEWIARDTRRYIKRQETWFKAESRMYWVDASQNENSTLQAVAMLWRNHGVS
jgi:tRNA dimethylallyltransferase